MSEYIFLESLDYGQLVKRLNQFKQLADKNKKKAKIITLNGKEYDLTGISDIDLEELDIILQQVNQVYYYPQLIQVDQALNFNKFLYAEYKIAQLLNRQNSYDIAQCRVCNTAMFRNTTIFEEAIELPCNHVVHTQCAYKLVNLDKLTCPVCQQDFKTPLFVDSQCVGCLNLQIQNSVLFRKSKKEMKLTFLFLKKFNQYLAQDFEVNLLLPFNNEGEETYQKIEASFHRGKLFRKLFMKANQNQLFDQTIIQAKFAVLNTPKDLVNYNNSEERYLEILSRQMDQYLEK